MLASFPEVELLLLLARQSLDDAQRVRVAQLTGEGSAAVDWARFIDLAVQHRVAPLAGWHSLQLLRHGRRSDVSGSALFLLQEAYLAGVSRSGPVKRELARIVEACGGLSMAVRKGGHLAFHIYREPGLRPMGDFDVLVTREEAPAVAAALCDLGYLEGELAADDQIRPFTRRQRVFWHMHGSDLPRLSRRAGSPFIPAFCVDINVELTLPGKGPRVPVDEFLARAVPGSIGGTPCSILAPEDTLIDLSLNLYKSSTILRFMAGGKHRRLLKYVDLAEFLSHVGPGFRWQVVAERVKALGVGAAVYYALAHLDMLFPGSVPVEVLADLGGSVAEPAAFLQAYGQWDLAEPRIWQVPFLEWFFDPAADAELPPSRSLV